MQLLDGNSRQTDWISIFFLHSISIIRSLSTVTDDVKRHALNT